MEKTVLILGARGRVGLAAARAFAQAGWQVVGLLRPGAAVPQAGGAPIRWVHADLADTAAVAALAPGAKRVLHALNPVYTRRAWEKEALLLTEQALAISRALNATLMLVGNVYNFGEDMPALLREDTPQRAHTPMGRIRVAMEARLRYSGVRSVVLRAGNFFGSGRGSWLDQAMVPSLRQGRLVYPGPAEVATAWAYTPDLARALVGVAEASDRLSPFAVLHFAGHCLSGLQWQQALQPIAQEQGWLQPGRALALRGMPWGVIRLGALFKPEWAALLEMRYLWQRAHALDNQALCELLGQEPHTPLEQALRQSLADLELLAPGSTDAPALAAV